MPDNGLTAQLAMVFVIGWGTGCAVNPLSGTNLTLHGRYGVNNWRIGRENLAFASLLCGAAIALMHLYAALFL